MSESPPPRRLNTDLIVSGAAIFISLCTLAVLLYEANLMREQQQASVWPYVEAGPRFRGDGFGIVVMNQGIGPARIQSMQVEVDGAPVRSWGEAFAALGIGAPPNSITTINGRVLPAQSEEMAVETDSVARRTELIDALFSDEPPLTIAVCYCSVYDECWHLNAFGLDGERTPVARCVSSDVEFSY